MISDHPFLCGVLALLVIGASTTSGLVCLVCSAAGIAAAAALLIADRHLYS